MPVRPKNVSRRPPIATPSRLISASPRVSSAPFVLSPYPSPSQTPAAMAITFLSAPPYSQPTTSSFVYTRSRGVAHSDLHRLRRAPRRRMPRRSRSECRPRPPPRGSGP